MANPDLALVTSPTIRSDVPADPDDWAEVVLVKGIVAVTWTIERATTGTGSGVIVSVAPVLALANNVNARSRVLTNNSATAKIYIGKTNAVAASGPAMGILLMPNGGSYTDSGIDLYTGDIYAISDAISAVENLAVWERT